MLIKERDSLEGNIAELTEIKEKANLDEKKRRLIEREIAFIKKGAKGEEDSAYFIDFHFRNSKNWAVIHDLRLQLNGHVAQIDHLLINRFLNIFVLESKNFREALQINERGEFFFIRGNKLISIESPIEQNRRHAHLLEKFLETTDILPTRLGMRISPAFKAFVLVSPKLRVIRPINGAFNTDMVIKSDAFYEVTQQLGFVESLGMIGKMISPESLEDTARKLASHHVPAKIDYYRKFKISRAVDVENKTDQDKIYFCFSCKKQVPMNVARFCWQNRTRFGGRVYCFECQRLIKKEA